MGAGETDFLSGIDLEGGIKSSLSTLHKFKQIFGEDVAKYYLLHKDAFEEVREELSTCGTQYPVMKLMDMCMWQAEFEAE